MSQFDDYLDSLSGQGQQDSGKSDFDRYLDSQISQNVPGTQGIESVGEQKGLERVQSSLVNNITPEQRQQAAGYTPPPQESPEDKGDNPYTAFEFASDLFNAITDIPEMTVSSVARAIEGDKPSFDDSSVLGYLVKHGEELSKKRREEMEGRASEGETFMGISPEDVSSVQQSTGFTGTSMLAGLGAGLGTLAATKSPGAAWTAGGVGSGWAAKRMAANQFMTDTVNVISDSIKEQTGIDLTPEQKVAAAAQIVDEANRYGWWEAIPEAASNVAGLKIIRGPLGDATQKVMNKILGKKIAGSMPARAVAKLGKLYGVELGTETITQVGQQGIESEIGLTDEAPRTFTSPTDIAESFKEVFAPTVLLTTLFGGAAGVGSLTYDQVKGLKEKTAGITDSSTEKVPQIDGMFEGERAIYSEMVRTLNDPEADDQKKMAARDAIGIIENNIKRRVERNNQQKPGNSSVEDLDAEFKMYGDEAIQDGDLFPEEVNAVKNAFKLLDDENATDQDKENSINLINQMHDIASKRAYQKEIQQAAEAQGVTPDQTGPFTNEQIIGQRNLDQSLQELGGRVEEAKTATELAGERMAEPVGIEAVEPETDAVLEERRQKQAEAVEKISGDRTDTEDLKYDIEHLGNILADENADTGQKAEARARLQQISLENATKLKKAIPGIDVEALTNTLGQVNEAQAIADTAETPEQADQLDTEIGQLEQELASMLTGKQEQPAEQTGAVPGVASKNKSVLYDSNDNEHEVTYKVVDINDLNATVDQADNQWRNRAKKESELQIEKISNNLIFEKAGESPVMELGAPVIAADGRIIAGNGRVMGISSAYEKGKAEKYKQRLVDSAERIGIDPEAIKGIKNPVLIRELGPDANVKEMAMISNEGETAAMSELEQAGVDAERLGTLPEIEMTKTGELNKETKLRLAEQILKGTPSNKAGNFVSNGELTKEGERRVHNALLARAYTNTDILRGLVESTDEGIRTIGRGLVEAAPTIANMRDDIKGGRLYPADILESLVQAVDIVNDIRKGNINRNLEDFLSQEDMLDPLPQEVKDLTRLIDKSISSKKHGPIVELLTNYAEMLETWGDPNQEGMFEQEAPTVLEVLNRAIDKQQTQEPGETDQEEPGSQAGLELGTEETEQAAEEVTEEEQVGEEAAGEEQVEAFPDESQVVPFPYISGMSSISDFKAALEGNAGVGVDANLISKNVIDEIAKAVAAGKQVFVDSGAFSAYKAAVKKGPLAEDLNFDKVFDVYDQISEKVSNELLKR
jgi:hypothetical protein